MSCNIRSSFKGVENQSLCQRFNSLDGSDLSVLGGFSLHTAVDSLCNAASKILKVIVFLLNKDHSRVLCQ